MNFTHYYCNLQFQSISNLNKLFISSFHMPHKLHFYQTEPFSIWKAVKKFWLISIEILECIPLKLKILLYIQDSDKVLSYINTVDDLCRHDTDLEQKKGCTSKIMNCVKNIEK